VIEQIMRFTVANDLFTQNMGRYDCGHIWQVSRSLNLMNKDSLRRVTKPDKLRCRFVRI
jgi:hypothetical protein